MYYVQFQLYHRLLYYIIILQATGDISPRFISKVMEPHLIIFEAGDEVSQIFVCAENTDLFEMNISTMTIADGICYLMAAYYVFNIAYPPAYKPMLYFFQDILMDKPDRGSRPTRYSTFVAKLGL